LLREESQHLAALSKALPGYSIRLAGHSLGAGVAAVVTYLLNTR
jgi:thioesterase domain-containing protein